MPGDSGTSFVFPCWFDLNLARTGQEFARKYFGELVFANVFGLVAALADSPTRRVLFLTGKSNTPEKAFKRYLASVQQVHLWYHSDILSSWWATSIRNVRKIHSYASFYVESLNSSVSKLTATRENNLMGFQPNKKLWKAFKMDLRQFSNGSQSAEFENSDPKFKLNHYGMTLTLWGVLALPVLNPVSLGIVMPSDEKGLKGFVHLWSIIRYALRTDEQFIFCKDTRSDNDWRESKRQLRDIHIFETLVAPTFELGLRKRDNALIDAFGNSVDFIYFILLTTSYCVLHEK
ncbi:unnamed protein product [Allacma fusca]|uniref:ER-bound oxygenase mpaB/mpaB'/Rubber oxygenase catalytic domain-containing protein n=1 Tax=Allacma fusca TaxID=39272 RepID=A0A8J2NID5_9HEXA|nr:unnamed protein product [Allacma fusca]